MNTDSYDWKIPVRFWLLQKGVADEDDVDITK
jgi:hypothetical protein